MSKQVLFLLLLAAAAGGIYFFINYEIQPLHQDGKPTGWKIVPKKGARDDSGGVGVAPFDAPARPTIRIATFQLGRLDEAKLADPRVADVLVRLFPRFDLIAVQGVRGKNQGALVRLVGQIGAASGRSYDFATCPTQRRDALEHYGAFVFDPARIDVDRNTVRFVEDHLDRFRFKPLVGLFRARGPDPAEAFTFALINVEVDDQRTAGELDLLAEVYRAVMKEGRNEDDIIILGNLNADDQNLGGLGKLLGVTALLSKKSDAFTTTRGTQLLDNILLDRRLTREFTGLVEATDLMREFELTMSGALQVSEHLPVWAEFSAYEGGQPGLATGGL
ncbi:MAG: endonuclease/exonuclease/phosphatase [Pirellulales bacterium]|nr:endonuclease/exonuclease/phosphatase [Pirellulales bacterium]